MTLHPATRKVGIAAPSSYNHFEDREAIVAAVIDSAFTQSLNALRAVVDVRRSGRAAARHRRGLPGVRGPAAPR